MRTTTFKIALVSAVAALCFASTSFAQTVVYQQTSTTGLTTNNTTPAFALDDITFAPGATAVLQQLSALTFGVGVAPGTTLQTAVVFIDFYNTVNPAAVGAVTADYIGGFGGTINVAANTTTNTAFRAFTFNNLTTLSNPIFFNDNNIGVVITLANAAGSAYSTVLTPLMSNPGVPTTGASATGVYRDANGNGTFESAEFMPTQGNLYLSMTTVAVPEPTTWALLGIGAIGLAAAARRSAKQRRGA